MHCDYYSQCAVAVGRDYHPVCHAVHFPRLYASQPAFYAAERRLPLRTGPDSNRQLYSGATALVGHPMRPLFQLSYPPAFLRDGVVRPNCTVNVVMNAYAVICGHGEE